MKHLSMPTEPFLCKKGHVTLPHEVTRTMVHRRWRCYTCFVASVERHVAKHRADDYARHREWYKKNRDYVRRKVGNFNRGAGRELRRACAKRYYERHRDEIRDKVKARREKLIADGLMFSSGKYVGLPPTLRAKLGLGPPVWAHR